MEEKLEKVYPTGDCPICGASVYNENHNICENCARILRVSMKAYIRKFNITYVEMEHAKKNFDLVELFNEVLD